MIYRWDDLCESQDFEHDQKFVKAEHWREACNELEDKVKTIVFKDQEITKLKKALEIANGAIGFYADTENWQTPEEQGFCVDDLSKGVRDMIESEDSESGYGGDKAREAQKQIKEVLEG